MRVVAIVQARMSSTRLPGKVLLDLIGQPMLHHVVERLRQASTINDIVIATSDRDHDTPIADFCSERKIACFRGELDDVLDRYYRAAKANQAELIVRITSDCPLIDPEVVDRVVKYAQEHIDKIDYVSNTYRKRTYPRGLDTEVFTWDALDRAFYDTRNPEMREHVTPLMYRSSFFYRAQGIESESDESHHRWTVDTPEDFILIENIYRHFGHNRMSWREVLAVLELHPEWIELNRHIEQKTH
jgi:spore coat polysaccharide biosynthesis protein SpsF